MKKIIDKILYRLGYTRRDELGVILLELARESSRRNGSVMSWVGHYVKIQIRCVDIFK